MWYGHVVSHLLRARTRKGGKEANLVRLLACIRVTRMRTSVIRVMLLVS